MRKVRVRPWELGKRPDRAAGRVDAIPYRSAEDPYPATNLPLILTTSRAYYRALSNKARCMHTVSRSVIVSYDASEMYDLVNDVERYPDFLPWCYEAKVLEATEAEKKAMLGLSLAGFHKHFTTRNRMQPTERIDISLLNGPFRELNGGWRFQSLGNQASKVSIELRFEFSSRLLEFAIGNKFEGIAGGMVEAFHRRAKVVYGKR